MKFTSEDLMKAMGLKVGDRVKDCCHTYEIINDDWLCLKVIDSEYKIGSEICNITNLLGRQYEILPQPKRVGDLKCGTKGKDGQETCSNCAIKTICQLSRLEGETLYKIFEDVFKFEDYFDQEIYDLLKARLDKEVKDNDSKSI